MAAGPLAPALAITYLLSLPGKLIGAAPTRCSMTSKRSSLLSLLCGLSAAPFALAAAEDPATYSCTYKAFSRCESGVATVKLLEGKVHELSFENTVCGTKGKPPKRCVLLTTRSGTDTWSEEGQGVRVVFSEASKRRHKGLDDEMVVSVEGDQVVLDFTETQTVTRCDDGAEMPEKLTILKETAQCKTVF
jgi:hypothetical protein